MKTNINNLLIAVVITLYSLSSQAVDLCGDKTIDRQALVPLNVEQCITDHGHYLTINVPFENSDVTIATSGGTFASGRDVSATIQLFSSRGWDGDIEAESATQNTNEESISFVSPAGIRYFYIDGNIQQTTLLVTVTGGDIPVDPELCGDKTIDRQVLVPLNIEQCITDHGHFLTINVPFENSDVTITTSGGTFASTSRDESATIKLFSSRGWDGDIEAESATQNTNEESISFVSPAGIRYFSLGGNIQQTTLLVTVTGGDIPVDPPCGDRTIGRTGEIKENSTHCLTNRGHRFSINILNDDANVVIKTSGGTFEGVSDATLKLHAGNDQSDENIVLESDNEGTNNEELTFTSKAGIRYFTVLGDIAQVTLSVTVTGGIAKPLKLCGNKTIDRQALVPLNVEQCITDYGHFLTINVPLENSDVTITTSGGTFSSIDATISLYRDQKLRWNGDIEAESATQNTNEESISFVSPAGIRYFSIGGDIQQTTLLVTVTGGDIPPPLGDYIVYDTDLEFDAPDSVISSKAGYADIVTTILAASTSKFRSICESNEGIINDISDALLYLANVNNVEDEDAIHLLFFLNSYKYYGSKLTTEEAKNLSVALQAIATMTDFLSPKSGELHQRWAYALENFERYEGASYFKEQLPHLLAILQYYSLQDSPFTLPFGGSAIEAIIKATGSALLYGRNSDTKKAFNNNILNVLSVLRSFAFLGRTSLAYPYSKEVNKTWVLSLNLVVFGRLAVIATDEVKARIDEVVIDTYDKVIQDISADTAKEFVTRAYLRDAKRECGESDALFNRCLVLPKIEDVLTVTHACSNNIIIRAESTITEDILTKSCQELNEVEEQFHTLLNTNRIPLANDQNETLEVVVFANPDNYKNFGIEFFGIDTDNGGIYMEGNPEGENNQARFIAEQCWDRWIGNTCQYKNQVHNLKHEYVHYLDGRYIKPGGFNHFEYSVSWSEGLADYLAFGKDYTRTIKGIEGDEVPPLFNILFSNYEQFDDIYAWSFLAIRFLDEKHPIELKLIAQSYKEDDDDAHAGVLDKIAISLNGEFQQFALKHSTTIAPTVAVIPSENTIGGCDLHQQYVKRLDGEKTTITVTNPTEIPVSIFWLDNRYGKTEFDKKYATLKQGDDITLSWKEYDRLVFTDNNLNCLGISQIRKTGNNFVVNKGLVENVIPEVMPKPDQLGHCNLEKPHIISDKSHKFTITNTTDYSVRLFRIDNITGKPIHESGADKFTYGYGVLQPGESYSNPVWYGDRRLMLTDMRLNCLSVAVLNNEEASYIVDKKIIMDAKPVEVIPEVNTLGSCDLMQKHLKGPDKEEANFSFINNTKSPLRIHRVDADTGEISESFGFTTLLEGETYDSVSTFRWYADRRAVITDQSNKCLGVAVFSQGVESGEVNTYSLTEESIKSHEPKVIGDMNHDGIVSMDDLTLFLTAVRSGKRFDLSYDFNNDGVVNAFDMEGLSKLCTYDKCSNTAT